MPELTKKQKLKLVRKAVDENISTHGMDNNYGDDLAYEIEAILDGTVCVECGSYPRREWRDVHLHYVGCSKYDPIAWGHQL